VPPQPRLVEAESLLEALRLAEPTAEVIDAGNPIRVVTEAGGGRGERWQADRPTQGQTDRVFARRALETRWLMPGPAGLVWLDAFWDDPLAAAEALR